MKRNRRTFTKQFKNEVIQSLESRHYSLEQLASIHSIPAFLIVRWRNDYLANNKIPQIVRGERRKDYNTVEELKMKIAELYLKLDKIEKKPYSVNDKVSRV